MAAPACRLTRCEQTAAQSGKETQIVINVSAARIAGIAHCMRAQFIAIFPADGS